MPDTARPGAGAAAFHRFAGQVYRTRAPRRRLGPLRDFRPRNRRRRPHCPDRGERRATAESCCCPNGGKGGAMTQKRERLDTLLVRLGYFPSREKAQAAVMAGLVDVE